MHAALAAGATLVAVAFACATFERYLDHRGPHQLVWAIALAFFSGATAALWAGASLGWHPATFRLFYGLGAVVNVPVLALGTVYLLANRRTANLAAISVGGFSAWALGVVMATPLRADALAGGTIPRGSDVFGTLPRLLAAVGSGVGATVLLAGAALSVVRLLRGQRSRSEDGASATTRAPSKNLALANGLIGAGTLVLSAGGLFNSTLDEMNSFTVSLVLGIALMFAGFLLTTPRQSSAGAAAIPNPAGSAAPASAEHAGNVVNLHRSAG